MQAARLMPPARPGPAQWLLCPKLSVGTGPRSPDAAVSPLSCPSAPELVAGSGFECRGRGAGSWLFHRLCCRGRYSWQKSRADS